jgi:anti-sigma regulatory factor (Ser/Thr protein kinase)
MEILLCIEEVLSNVVRHGTPEAAEDEIWVRANLTREEIEVQVIDNGAAFDPLAQPPPRLDLPLSERRTGGLGIHLVRQMMDRVQYERANGRNCLTIARRIAGSGAA